MVKKHSGKCDIAKKDVKLSINENALQDFGNMLESGLNSILNKYSKDDITYEMINSLASTTSQIAAEIGFPKKDFIKIMSEYYDETFETVEHKPSKKEKQLN